MPPQNLVPHIESGRITGSTPVTRFCLQVPRAMICVSVFYTSRSWLARKPDTRAKRIHAHGRKQHVWEWVSLKSGSWFPHPSELMRCTFSLKKYHSQVLSFKRAEQYELALTAPVGTHTLAVDKNGAAVAKAGPVHVMCV